MAIPTVVTQDYDPSKVRLYRLYGKPAQLGLFFTLGQSRLGQTDSFRDEICMSRIRLTNSYSVGDTGEVEIDPITGTASISEIFRPGVSDKVINQVLTPFLPGDNFELNYDDYLVCQGVVEKVDVSLEVEDDHWVRNVEVSLLDMAGLLTRPFTIFSPRPSESPFIRLDRYFDIDTTRLASDQISYISSLRMPADDPTELPRDTTYVEQAREFTRFTKFPVRQASIIPQQWEIMSVLPMVKWKGVEPPAFFDNAECWAHSAEWAFDNTGKKHLESADVITDTIIFLSGEDEITTQPVSLGQFYLGSSRLGTGYNITVSSRVPFVVDAFGTKLVVSKITHDFSKHYRNSLEFTPFVAVP